MRTRCSYALNLYMSVILLWMCCICVSAGCDDDDYEGGGSSLIYDVEGPRGLVRSTGPWLVRVGVPPGASVARYALSLRLTHETSGGEVSGAEVSAGEVSGAEVSAGEVSGAEISAGETSSAEVEERRVTLVASARPDVFFALIPETPLYTEVSYQLLIDAVGVTSSYRFKRLPPVRDEVSPPTSECLINLDAPDPKSPVSARDDRAPQHGIQRIYQVSVYLTRDRIIDMEESASLSGLVTLTWLTVSAELPPEEGALLTLSGGRARSLPMTTPLGEQKLLIRALTERGARCARVIEFTSL